TVLDLAGADPISSTVDHIIRAPLIPVEAVGIAAGKIPSASPAVDELGAARFRIMPVLQEHHRVSLTPDRDLAHLAAGDLFTSIVEEGDTVSGVGATHGPWPGTEQGGAAADYVVHLGLAEDLVDGHAKLSPDPVHDRRADGLSATHQASQP